MKKVATSGLSKSRTSSGWHLVAGLCVVLMAALLTGCNGKVNMVQGISLVPGQTVELNKPLKFSISGVGRCDNLLIDWGDGSQISLGPSVRLPTIASHTFGGWPGGKTVTAIGITGCGGRVNTRFTIEPSVKSIAFAQPGTKVCNNIQFGSSSAPELKPRTLVHIKTIPATGGVGIDFGCPFQGCRYDADGKPGSVAAAQTGLNPGFPFPGLREYSLVLKVGTQVVQGGTDVRFTTNQRGALELCINDDSLSNNRGGYQIDISVDELGPVPPP